MPEAKPPYFPTYCERFIAQTILMDAETVGAYQMLKVVSWIQEPPCTLPNDESKLERYAKLAAGRWLVIGPAVMNTYQLVNGRWFDADLFDEYEKSLRRMKANRENGSKGGFAKNIKDSSSDGLATAKRPPTHGYGEATASEIREGDKRLEKEIEKKTKTTKPPRTATPSLSEGVWAKCRWRRIGKGAAIKAIDKAIELVAKEKAITPEEAAAYIARKAGDYTTAMFGADINFLPHPSTWFNRQQYDDDPSAWTVKEPSPLPFSKPQGVTFGAPVNPARLVTRYGERE